MCAYLAEDTKILMADCSYKAIRAIQVGDNILDMNGDLATVTLLKKVADIEMVELKYKNWYTPLRCTGAVEVMVDNWRRADDLKTGEILRSENGIYKSRLPETFSIGGLEPSFDLGLLFGLYAGYGTLEDQDIVLTFGISDELVEQISKIVFNLFNVKTTVSKGEYWYKVILQDKSLYNLFQGFGSKANRVIPREYLCTDEEYIIGVFEGLVDYEPETQITRFVPLSEAMAEFFVCLASLLNLSFINNTPINKDATINIYPLNIRNDGSDNQYQTVLNDLNEGERETGWRLVVDSPSNSFIANNLVVKC